MNIPVDRLKKNALFWFLLALLIFLLALIHRNWLFSLAPLISGDWPYFSGTQLKEWFPFHDLWIPYDGLGRSISQGNFVFLLSAYGWLAMAGLSFEVIARVLFFLPVVILAPYGAFLAVRQITAHKIGALIGAFVYSLNTYFLVIQGGHMHLCMVYALAPLAYYFALKNAPRSYFWLFTIIAIMALYDVRMTLVVGGFAIVIALWRKVKSRHDFILHAKKIALGFLVVALVHSFWILPAAFTSSGPFTRNVFQQNALNWVSQVDSLTLHHPFWSESGVTDFVFQPAPYYMFLLPLIAFVPFMIPRARLKKEMLFFGIASVLSIVLLMQENSLFKGVYQVIYDNVPLMSMFRESTKLFFITAFCYSVLIGVLIAELSRQGRKGWAFSSGGAVLMALIVPAMPYISGDFVKAFKKEPIADDMQAINRLVSEGKNGTRTLWVSRTPKFAPHSNQRPSVDALDLGQRFWSRHSDPFDGLSYLKQPYTTALLNFAGISHVAAPRKRIDSVFTHYNKMPGEHYQDMIDKLHLPGRREIGKNVVWENSQPKPHMYLATDVMRVDSLSAFSGIDAQPTAAYLFADQQPTAAKPMLDVAPTNIELNPFQAKYLRAENGHLVSNYQPEDGQKFDLYQPNRSSEQRSLDVTPHFDTSQPIRDAIPGLKNLYPGGALEHDTSFKVSDCNNYDNTSPTQNGISGKLVDDKAEGQRALQVTARRHTACFSKKIEQFDPNAYYLIGVDYKYIGGMTPRIGLYPYFNEPANRQVTLPGDKAGLWASHQMIIAPHDFTNEMYLNIYLPTSNKYGESKTLFDNIRVYKLPYLPEAYLRTKQPTLPAVPIQTKSDRPTKYRLDLQSITQPRLLVFSETFDPNWRLSIRKSGQGLRVSPADFIAGRQPGFTLGSDSHVIANGFANGWWIDPAALPGSIQNAAGDYEVILEYMPQRWFTIGLSVSSATIVLCAVYVIHNIRRVKGEERITWRRR